MHIKNFSPFMKFFFLKVYFIFISENQILLKIIKINKFNHKYWLGKSYFMLGISIKTLFYFSRISI